MPLRRASRPSAPPSTIDDHESSAEKLRAEQAEKLRKADELDPAVTTDARRDGDDRVTDGYTPAPGARQSAETVEDRRIVRDNPDAATPADRDGDGIRDDREVPPTSDGSGRTDGRV